MEQTNLTPLKISFDGTGRQLFGIQVVNLLLTIVTLGLYYPWAKAAYLKYIYQSTSYGGSHFSFEGTGKEMFVGFIKAVVILAIMYGTFLSLVYSQNTTLIFLGLLLFWIGSAVLVPFVIHGTLRYRLSRTTWRGIHFGYRGDLKELMKIFARDLVFTILTLGIYGAWLTMHMRNYTTKHIRFGNVKFIYNGDGGEFFILNLKGYFLTLLTLGIYAFWWQKDLLNYWLENLRIQQGNKELHIKSSITGGGVFGLLFVNLLIIVFTLGLGAPWATVRTFKFIFDNATLSEALDVEAIRQTEHEYKNATADELGDAIDIGLLGV